MLSRRRTAPRRNSTPTAEFLESRQLLTNFYGSVQASAATVHAPTTVNGTDGGQAHFRLDYSPNYQPGVFEITIKTTPQGGEWSYKLYVNVIDSTPEADGTVFTRLVDQVGSSSPIYYIVPDQPVTSPVVVIASLSPKATSDPHYGVLGATPDATITIIPGPKPPPSAPSPKDPTPQIPGAGGDFCGPPSPGSTPTPPPGPGGTPPPGAKPQATSTSAGGAATPPSVKGASGNSLPNGAVSVDPLTLYSAGFGREWGLATDWTSVSAYSAGGTVGKGFVNMFQPTLQPTADGGLRAVKSATDVQWFASNGSGGYAAAFYGRETLAYDSSTGDFVLTDVEGGVTRFYGFSPSIPALQQGRFKSYSDPFRPYVTAPGDMSHLVTTAYDSSGRMTSQQRVDGGLVETYTYNYIASGVNAGLLGEAVLSRTVGGTTTVVRKAGFVYYGNGEAGGNPGNLKREEVRDASGAVLDATYFRYYKADGATGFADGMKYVFHPEAFARLEQDVPGYETASETTIAPYADSYFEYDADRRVTKSVVQGAGCSCVGSSGAGQYTYSYSVSPHVASSAGQFNVWSSKTVETLPDGNQNTYYFNFAGGTVLQAFSVTTDAVDPSLQGKVWATSYRYDAAGRLAQAAQPSAVAIATPASLTAAESNPDLVGFNATTGAYQYLRPSAGVIRLYDHATATTATGSAGGDVAGFLKAEWLKQGYSGAAIRQAGYQYYDRSAAGSTVNPLASSTVYRNENGTGAQITSYKYFWFAGTNQASVVEVSLPVVSAAQNGFGATDIETTILDPYGRAVWYKDAAGYLHYSEYDMGTGAVTKNVVDADTSLPGQFAFVPSFVTPSGGGLNLITQYQVDALGRALKTTDPAGRVTWRVYKDLDREVRTYRGWNAQTGTATGPVEIARHDDARSYVETLTLAGTVGRTGTAGSYVPDGSEAIVMGSVRSLLRTLYDKGGRVSEQVAYHDLAGLTYSRAYVLDVTGAKYYATKYGYDHRGRLSRVVDAVGTISATAYDALARAFSRSIGTADGFGGTGTSNMAVVARYQYDGGGVGDGNLTTETLYPDTAANAATARVTAYAYDWRNRLIAYKSGVQNSEAEDVQRQAVYLDLDNLGQVVAVWQYDADAVALSAAKPDAGRLRAYAAYDYDDQGWAYRERAYHVDPSSGVWNASHYLETSTFYDRRGFAVATYSPGGTVSKAAYDGAGRLLSAAVSDGWGDGGSWFNAGNLAGDRVLSETRLTYNAAGDVIQTTSFERSHDATNTGPLSGPGSRGTADSGFEAVDVAPLGGIAGSPAGTPWAFAGPAGITANQSAFTSGNRNAPEGGQVAYLMGTATISQTRTDWQAGTYTISFKAARRAGDAVHSFKLVVDGVDVPGATFTPSSSAAYQTFSATFSLAAGVHKIAFVGVTPGTTTSFIDDVAVAFGAALVGDTGFEDATPPSGGIGGASPSWSFTAGGGIASTSSAFFTGAPVPSGVQGSQVLYLQSNGGASQSVNLAAGGYTVSFKAAQRQNAANQQQVIQVYVTPPGGSAVLVATFKPSGSALESFAAGFTAAAAGTYTITLVGTVTAGDNTAFVDAFSLSPTSARTSYAAFYYDAAGRNTHAVDVGTNGGRPYDQPVGAPARSDTTLLTEYFYDDAGRLGWLRDPRGIGTRYAYDALGRVKESVANFTVGPPSAAAAPSGDTNSTIRYTYDGLGQVVTVTAVSYAGTPNQVTTYNYGITTAGGNAVNSNGALRSVVQPDGATTTYVYNALGQVSKATDPNGTVHQYGYDVLGRFRSDSVTTFAAGVDQTVKRLETAYDSAGRAYLFTSFNSAAGGTANVTDEVKRTFNGYGQVLREYQSHSGAVVDATTPYVAYGYSALGAVANDSRPVSMTYPVSGTATGRVLGYAYGTGLDAAIGRASSVNEGATVLESYQYLGLGAVVERAQPGSRSKLTYVRQAGDAAARNDGGDQYSGIDRFGRIADQNWVRTSASVGGAAAGTSTVRHQYEYDRSGNALSRRDLVFQALSELYAYDGLDRLSSYKRGVLTASTPGGRYDTVATPLQQQSWALDARGNQLSVTTTSATTGTTTVSRTFNAANEAASVSVGTAPTYDDAGNTRTKDGRAYVYDAWNRLKSVSQGGTTLATYAYDALRRRIKETPSVGSAVDVYYDGSRPIEERTGGTAASNATAQYVYGATGQMVFRDVVSSGSVVPASRLYPQQTANGDVVALIGGATANAGDAQERYSYLPYGSNIVMAGNGVLIGGTAYSWRHLFQGGRLDSATGLYVFGFRDYDPSAGVWMQRDPIGLDAGDANTYRFVGNNPVNYDDPSGLLPSMKRGHWASRRPGDGLFIFDKSSAQNLAAGVAGARVRFEGGYIAPGGFPASWYYKGSAENATVNIVKVIDGDRIDFAQADNAMREALDDPKWVRPEGYTWNHAGKPGCTTMELVETTKHKAVSHKGSASLVRAAKRALEATEPAFRKAAPALRAVGKTVTNGKTYLAKAAKGSKLARAIPFVGPLLGILATGSDVYGKGVVNGSINSGLDSIPVIGLLKVSVEIVRGKDFIPDSEPCPCK